MMNTIKRVSYLLVLKFSFMLFVVNSAYADDLSDPSCWRGDGSIPALISSGSARKIPPGFVDAWNFCGPVGCLPGNLCGGFNGHWAVVTTTAFPTGARQVVGPINGTKCTKTCGGDPAECMPHTAASDSALDHFDTDFNFNISLPDQNKSSSLLSVANLYADDSHEGLDMEVEFEQMYMQPFQNNPLPMPLANDYAAVAGYHVADCGHVLNSSFRTEIHEPTTIAWVHHTGSTPNSEKYTVYVRAQMRTYNPHYNFAFVPINNAVLQIGQTFSNAAATVTGPVVDYVLTDYWFTEDSTAISAPRAHLINLTNEPSRLSSFLNFPPPTVATDPAGLTTTLTLSVTPSFTCGAFGPDCSKGAGQSDGCGSVCKCRADQTVSGNQCSSEVNTVQNTKKTVLTPAYSIPALIGAHYDITLPVCHHNIGYSQLYGVCGTLKDTCGNPYQQNCAPGGLVCYQSECCQPSPPGAYGAACGAKSNDGCGQPKKCASNLCVIDKCGDCPKITPYCGVAHACMSVAECIKLEVPKPDLFSQPGN